jgi:hypothetical protein
MYPSPGMENTQVPVARLTMNRDRSELGACGKCPPGG